MDLSYLMCSVMSPYQCTADPEAAIEEVSKERQQQGPELVESSCSETSHISDRSVDLSTSTIASAIAPSTAGSEAATATTTKQRPIPFSSKPGETSPSSLVLSRKLSTGIVTDPTKKKHPVLEGRPVVFQRNLTGDSTSLTTATTVSTSTTTKSVPPFNTDKASSTKSTNPEMAIATASPKSGPTRDSLQRDSDIGTMIPVTVTPSFHNGTSYDGDDKTQTQCRRESSARPSVVRRSYTCPSERVVAQQFVHEPAPLRLDAWTEPPAENFQVRGKTYAKDKVKVACESSYFRLLTVDLINSPRPIFGGLCGHPQERVQQALQRERETGIRELPDFVFCVNLCVPGQSIYHTAFYFGVDKVAWDEIKNRSTPSGRLMNQFIFGDSDEFRNRTFKLIPRIVEGNYIVRKSVGSKPSILGKKIVQKYVRTDRYMEVIVDIASDAIAQRIVKLCLGYIKTIVVDMMFVLEGNDESTLPERIFGGVRMKNIDFKDLDGKRVVLPTL